MRRKAPTFFQYFMKKLGGKKDDQGSVYVFYSPPPIYQKIPSSEGGYSEKYTPLQLHTVVYHLLILCLPVF